MNEKYKKLLSDLNEDITHCKLKALPEDAEIECCFQISSNYWNRIKQEIATIVFASPDEEIDFYKNVKPKFISEIEYFGLVYHTIWFRPKDSFTELKNFWINEMNRLEKFIKDNTEFYEYYILGSSWNDASYFTAAQNEPEKRSSEFFEQDKLMRSRPDYLVATIIALKKYKEYAIKELQASMENW
jgi:RteC protein